MSHYEEVLAKLPPDLEQLPPYALGLPVPPTASHN